MNLNLEKNRPLRQISKNSDDSNNLTLPPYHQS